MKLFLLTIAVAVVLGILALVRQDAPRPAPQAPVVIYRTVRQPAVIDRQAAADLSEMAEKARMDEFRRKWFITYGTVCPR